MENILKILVLLSFFHIKVVAQTSLIDKNYYGLKEGLPSQEVTDVVKSNNGLIWLSTVEGIVRFDGYKMQVFSNSNNTSTTRKIEFKGTGKMVIDTFQNLIITPPLTGHRHDIGHVV